MKIIDREVALKKLDDWHGSMSRLFCFAQLDTVAVAVNGTLVEYSNDGFRLVAKDLSSEIDLVFEDRLSFAEEDIADLSIPVPQAKRDVPALVVAFRPWQEGKTDPDLFYIVELEDTEIA